MKTTEISIISIRINSVKILLTIFVLIFMLSCKDHEELTLETTTLQGTWVETEPEDLIQLAGSNHTFVFREDSFFVKIESWTDVVYPGDTCEGCPDFGYAKGEYNFDLNTINFIGMRGLDSNYAEPDDSSRISTYHITYDYKLKSSNTLILNPESEYESITLVKE